MTTKLIEKPINEIIAGAKLGADVLDVKGRLLMPAGATLSDDAINKLMSRDVSSVTIIEKEVMSEEQLLVIKTDIENAINSRFRKTKNNQHMNELRQALIDFRIKNLDL